MLKKARLLTRPTLARRDAPYPMQGRSSSADPRFTFHASSERSENEAGRLFQHPAQSTHFKGGSMAEAADVYADQFQLNLGPLGCTLNFQVSGANPVAPGSPPPIERVATIRLSLQHLKAMAFILHKQIVGYEAQAQLSTGLPVDVLRALQIRQEDWEAFWRP
jgi:hypothetical protein